MIYLHDKSKKGRFINQKSDFGKYKVKGSGVCISIL